MTNPTEIGAAMLHVLQGAQQGRAFALSAPEVQLGREGGALDLSGYVQMSRDHARLFFENGAWSVQDCGSTNGTHVNGQRIATCRLQDGDVLKMGDFCARVSLPGQHGSTPGAARTQLVTDTEPTPLVPSPSHYPPPQNYPSHPWPRQPPPNIPAPSAYPHYPPPHYQVNNYVITPPKNPGLAAVLSFLFTGLGQFYNGEIGKGIGFWLAAFVAALLTCVIIGWFIMPVIWILSIVDAYQSAEQINRRAQM